MMERGPDLLDTADIIDFGLQNEPKNHDQDDAGETASEDFGTLNIHSDVSYLNSGTHDPVSPKHASFESLGPLSPVRNDPPGLPPLVAKEHNGLSSAEAPEPLGANPSTREEPGLASDPDPEPHGLPIDDAFQRSLNERAHQIGSECFHGAHPAKLNLRFVDADSETLRTEINDWFSVTELWELNLRELAAAHGGTALVQRVKALLAGFEVPDTRAASAQGLLYVAFGGYADLPKGTAQLDAIVANNHILADVGVVAAVGEVFKTLLRDDSPLYYTCLTLLYFVVAVHLDTQAQVKAQRRHERLRNELGRLQLFEYVVGLIERWRWSPAHEMRIRGLLLVAAKLVLVELGGTLDLEAAKRFLERKHGVERHAPSCGAKVSALDLHVFQEDVVAKFPTYSPPASDLPLLFDNPGSLSQLINKPRPLATNTMNAHLPAPEVHLSTPAPSPPSTPVPLPLNKTKRTFQTNQAYPFLYPSDSEEDEDQGAELAVGTDVPYSIVEASAIMHRHVRPTLAQKQLWQERSSLMQQERGWIDTFTEPAPEVTAADLPVGDSTAGSPGVVDSKATNHAQGPLTVQQRRAVENLLRLEQIYQAILPHLDSLVHVICQVIKANNFTLRLTPSTPLTMEVKHQLELLRVKELTLKAASGLLLLLCKWFKLSHVLKWVYLSSIIFDNDFYSAVLDLTGEKTPEKEPATDPGLAPRPGRAEPFDRLLNPAFEVPEFSFFAACITGPTAAPIVFNPLPVTDIVDFNWRFAHITTNLYTVMAKVSLYKTQRVIVLCDKKPADTFRYVLRYQNGAIYRPVLKLAKSLVAYNGRKWKSNNMDLISLVYLHSRLGLRDNWLAGKDIEGEIRDAYAQEVALRGLAQYYHIRRYAPQMSQLGYEITEIDFFASEGGLLG